MAKGVWIVAEQRDGALRKVSFELASTARKLADQLGDEVAAEAEAVQDALRARLRLIERVARLTAGPNLSDEEEDRLNALCQGLVEEPSP